MSRSQSREEAFKLLFQQSINEESKTIREKDTAFTKQLIDGVRARMNTIDGLIRTYSENWSFDRIGLVEKTILRIATYELMYTKDIPVGVAINEAVELANKYGDEHSGKFVNGILSKIADERKTSDDSDNN